MRRSLKTHVFYHFPRGGLDISWRASTWGCSPVQTDIGGVFCQNFFSRNVGGGQGGVLHPYWPDDQCRSHSHSNPYHWWSAGGWPGHGDHLLSAWSGKDRGLRDLGCPTTMWLARAEHGGGEEVCQYPQGTTQSLYLDVSILSTQFPLESLCLWRLIPFSKDEISLPHKMGNSSLAVYTLTMEALWQSSEERNCLSDPISLSPGSSGFLLQGDKNTHMERESGYHPDLWWLQEHQQAKFQQECELDVRTQELKQTCEGLHLKI